MLPSVGNLTSVFSCPCYRRNNNKKMAWYSFGSPQKKKKLKKEVKIVSNCNVRRQGSSILFYCIAQKVLRVADISATEYGIDPDP